MIQNVIFNEKKRKYRILKIFDFSEKCRFCWFFDKKVAISRRRKDIFDSKTRFGKGIKFYYEV